MASLYDGLGGEEITQSGLQAGGVNISPYFIGSINTASNINVAGSIIGAGRIGNAEGNINSVRQGASYGGFIQAGSTATSAGSNAWVTFPVAYGAAPQVVMVSPITTASGLYVSGTVTAGSFIVVSEGASQGFHWLSVGVK